MTSKEQGRGRPFFGIIEVPPNTPGFEPGDYLVTDIQTQDWISREVDLNSDVRIRLAG